jgi:hypothetical protein
VAGTALETPDNAASANDGSSTQKKQMIAKQRAIGSRITLLINPRVISYR